MRISGSLLISPKKKNSLTIAQQRRRSKLEFKRLDIDSIKEIKPYILYNVWRTCDYTIGGIMMWADYFNYEYCIVEDTLFIKGYSESHPDMVAFSMPMGKMDLSHSIDLLKEYCKSEGIKLTFSAIPDECTELVADLCDGREEKLEGWSDYLYKAEDLATLKGKAFSKKRNHVNRFLGDNPHYKFEMIDKRNIGQAREFMTRINIDEKSEPELAAYELAQCLDVVDNLDRYGFEGALLKDESGEVCAVTFGEVVGDTLYVHIEKMNHEVAGTGETINQMFSKMMYGRHARLAYINREEDMGDAGLRYAKESYHPTAILDKYNVISLY